MYRFQFEGIDVRCNTAREVRELLDGRPVLRPVALPLCEMPDDLADAYESLKLAIMRHHADGWKEISLADCDNALLALQTLAHAPPKPPPFDDRRIA